MTGFSHWLERCPHRDIIVFLLGCEELPPVLQVCRGGVLQESPETTPGSQLPSGVRSVAALVLMAARTNEQSLR